MDALRFHFDYISPYAYLAATQIHAIGERHGRAVELVPVLFAAILDAHGQKGPAEIEAKRRYTFRDVVRKAAWMGVPIAPPASHPFNPLLGLRATTAVPAGPARRTACEALYAATWGRSEDTTNPEVVASALTGAGLDGAALVAAAGTPEIKEELKSRTAAAIAEGVFGVPTILVGKEVFWGTDSLPLLERFLTGEDPLIAAHEDAWARIRPTARRKGSL